MSKLRLLFAIPCLAVSLALVGCGGSETTFEPVEDAPMVDEGADEDMDGGDPYANGGGEGEAPAAPEGEAPAAPEGEAPAAPEGEAPAAPEGEGAAPAEGGEGDS